MYYILCRATKGGESFYQETMRGVIQRYTDLNGITFKFAGESVVTDKAPPQPVWALPDTDLPPVKLSRAMPPLEFWRLFTPGEINALFTAMLLEVDWHSWVHSLDVAQAVDRDDAALQTKIKNMEDALILKPGRASEILNA